MSEANLYWVLLETDIDNSDLYLPPDTPIGSVNPEKLYSIYQKRHARQKERLIKQQVDELYQYRKAFSIDHKEDHFIKPSSAVCEIISGTNFLNKESEAISQLLSEIPNCINENTIFKKKEFKQDNSDKIKQDYYEILIKKFKSGTDVIEKFHLDQLLTLENIQDSDFKAIPKETLYKLDPTRFRSYNPWIRDRERDRERDRDRKRKRKEDKEDINKQRREEYKRRYKTPSPSPPLPPELLTSSPPPLPSLPLSNPLKPNTTFVGIPNNVKPPTVVASPINSPHNDNKNNINNSRSPIVAASAINSPNNKKKKNNKNNKNNNNNINKSFKHNPIEPPTVGGSSHNNKNPPSIITQSNNKSENKRRSSTPLFTTPTQHRIYTLMDNGSLIIQNKPQRVIIRNTNGTSGVYGHPKDYDDAMNSSVTRKDNPVYKRRMNGTEYLFFKNENGGVVTIGPVTKIRPLIQKFFLSM